MRNFIDLDQRRRNLGLTLEMFGRRLGVSRQSAHQLEKSVRLGSVTLNRLDAAANALDCDLEVRFVPRHRLHESVIDRVAHTMSLEGQELTTAQITELRREI